MTILIIILAISLLVLAHEAGHFFAAKLLGVEVEEFGIGFPPRLLRVKGKETTYSINALPFGGFVKLKGEFEPASSPRAYGKAGKRDFLAEPAWKKAVILSAGVVMNLVVAWALLTVVFWRGIPTHVAVSGTAADSPASSAGLREGDIIMGAEKGDVTLTNPVAMEDFLNLTRTNPAEPLTLTVGRDGKEFVTHIVGRANPPAGEGVLGIELVNIGVEGVGPLRAVGKAAGASLQTFVAVLGGLWHIVVQAVTGKGGFGELSGPIGVFVIARSVGMLGALYLVQLFAIISVNLAALNIIPFPALDGGRLLLVGIEKLRGKPVAPKVHKWFNTVGFFALILLMVLVTFKDLMRFVF